MRKILASLLIAASAITGVCGDVAHLFETNSTAEARKFHTYCAKNVYMIPTPNYVTNGLTHWYDGQINIGIGWHKSGFVPFWRDLVGDRDLLVTSEDAVFSDRSFDILWKHQTTPISTYTERTMGIAACDKIPDDEIVTVEVCATLDTRVPMKENGTYMTLVCNGNENERGGYYYPMSIFMGFAIDTGSYISWSGNHYRLVAGRGEDLSIRCLSVYSTYDFFPSQSSYMMFTYSMSNPDKSQTYPTTGSGYYQPFQSASLLLCEFIVPSVGEPDFSRTVFKTSESPTRYNTDGYRQAETTSLQRFITSGDSFTIGGVRLESSYGSYPERHFFDGKIFCVRIYNRVLTEAERKENAKIDLERFWKYCRPTN